MVFTKTNGKKGRPTKSMTKEFESVILRTGGRVKKAKKVFDPSEYNPPRTRGRHPLNDDSENANGSSLQSKTFKKKKIVKISYYKRKKLLAQKALEGVCTICTKKSSNLIHCLDCNVKVHQICLNTNFQNSNLLETKWRCDNCKNCAMCYENAERGPLITCSVCVDCYHFNCHIPNISSNEENNKTNWICTKCLPKPQFKPGILKSRRKTISSTLVLSKHQINNDSSESEKTTNTNIKAETDKIIDSDIDMNTVYIEDDDEYDGNDDNVESERIRKKNKKEIIGLVPDVSKWSCDQLSDFVKEFFPVEAKILREQEIDGASLLLLSRSDVITGLKLKLGPAIRLYNFITILQTKKKNVTATWIY